MTAEERERRRDELSELIGLLRQHSAALDDELANDRRPRHTWLIIDAAKRLRDALSTEIERTESIRSEST